ncbi:hypothetical protein D3C71_21610 [compost metagenome]
MSNALALAVATLEDVIAEQGGHARSMTDDVLVVSAVDSKGSPLAYFKSPAYQDYLDEDVLQAMLEADVLLNEGEIEKKRLGRRSEYVLGIRMDALQRAARAAEIAASEVQALKERNKKVERALRVARDHGAADRAMAELINKVAGSFRVPARQPKVTFDRTTVGKTKALAGIPTLFLSDWHWGEMVTPSQVEYLNEFNLTIANRRADRVFDSSLSLLFKHMSGQHYDGMTIILGGDMLSGNIHEELRQTNDAPIHVCVLTLAEKLAEKICMVASQFKWLYVPGVVGNHGRIDRKPTAKNAVVDNYDWLVYELVRQLVVGRLGAKCNVEFDISPSLDLSYQLYGTRYLLTHGDQIGGGSGVGGFWPSMMRTAHRKQERAVANGSGGFDYMICGHFHKYGNVANVIVNGSLKGYDEWVYKMNFGYEKPIQALWVTHPHMGIIDHRPVYADEAVVPAKAHKGPAVLNSTSLLKSERVRG